MKEHIKALQDMHGDALISLRRAGSVEEYQRIAGAWEEALEAVAKLVDASLPENYDDELSHCEHAVADAKRAVGLKSHREYEVEMVMAERAAARASASNWGLLRRLSEEWAEKHALLQSAALRMVNAVKSCPADVPVAVEALEAEARKL